MGDVTNFIVIQTAGVISSGMFCFYFLFFFINLFCKEFSFLFIIISFI